MEAARTTLFRSAVLPGPPPSPAAARGATAHRETLHDEPSCRADDHRKRGRTCGCTVKRWDGGHGRSRFRRRPATAREQAAPAQARRRQGRSRRRHCRTRQQGEDEPDRRGQGPGQDRRRPCPLLVVRRLCRRRPKRWRLSPPAPSRKTGGRPTRTSLCPTGSASTSVWSSRRRGCAASTPSLSTGCCRPRTTPEPSSSPRTPSNPRSSPSDSSSAWTASVGCSTDTLT